jgi:hypothetical protein
VSEWVKIRRSDIEAIERAMPSWDIARIRRGISEAINKAEPLPDAPNSSDALSWFMRELYDPVMVGVIAARLSRALDPMPAFDVTAATNAAAYLRTIRDDPAVMLAAEQLEAAIRERE